MHCHSERSRTLLRMPLFWDVRPRNRSLPAVAGIPLRLGLMLLPLLLICTVAFAQEPAESLPKLISHADAAYPQIAKTAHITGDVVVKITTDGQSVIDAKAESGPPVLLKASVDNAKTWKFAPHTPATFHVTYRYQLATGDVFTSFPNSSTIVEISAEPGTITGDHARISLGRWQATLKSPQGDRSVLFEFSCTGDWLDVDSPNASKADEGHDDDYGHLEGGFFVFSIRLGQPFRTFFVGKMDEDKIAGAFVDESGTRGTWTATRIPDPEKR
jgi:hypothetical protein